MISAGSFTILCGSRMLKSYSSGMEDIRTGLRMHSLWLALATEDITDQHRRTFLGPAWILVNYLAYAGTFVIIFGRGGGIPEFPTYIATGLYVWLYLSETMIQSITLFTKEESFIKGTTLPLSVYVLRLTTQSAIRAGFTLVGCVAIITIWGTEPDIVWLWSVPAILLIIVVTPAAITISALAGAYFPDLQFFAINVVRIGFFLTPIFWIDTGGGGLRTAIYTWNPFTYFLEIVRAPVHSGIIPSDALLICSVICLLLWAIALPLLGSLKKRIAFVL